MLNARLRLATVTNTFGRVCAGSRQIASSSTILPPCSRTTVASPTHRSDLTLRHTRNTLPQLRQRSWFSSEQSRPTAEPTHDDDDSDFPINEEAVTMLAELKEENERLIVDLKELQDKYKRQLAETENVRMRMQKQVNDAKIYSIQGFCKDLLDLPDILKKALDSVPEELLTDTKHEKEMMDALKSLYDGVSMTHSMMLKNFAHHGLVLVDPLGEPFDPNLHEAMFEIPTHDEYGPGVIGHVAKVGYSLHDRPIRPAKVGVVKLTK